MKQLCAIDVFAFLCVHTLGERGAAPHPSVFSRASPPLNPVSAEQGCGCCLCFGFFSTKDSKRSNEESANFFFPFPLKVQASSMELDGIGRASQGLFSGNRVRRKTGPISNHHVE